MTTDTPTILYPTPSYFPAQSGGPDNTNYWLTKALTKKGVKTIISSTDFGLPEDVKRDEWLDTEYGRVKYTHNPVHYMPLTTIYHAMREIRNADIIHLTMITYPASWITAFLNAFTYRKQVVWSSHGDLDPYMLKRSVKKKRFVLWLINKVIGVKNIWFHSTCDAETTYIRDQFGPEAKVVQITNYMDIPQRVHQEKQRDILFLGRIDKKKGIENLLEGARRSEVFMNSNFRLLVAGDHLSPYGQELVALTEKLNFGEGKVVFVGHKTGLEKEELLARSHFLIMPSHTENFGIVVTEALAQATPAVASTGTPWKLLDDYEAGFWIDNDPQSITTVLERIINMPAGEYATYQENALRLVQEEFSIDENIDKWVEFYRSLVHASVPHPVSLVR